MNEYRVLLDGKCMRGYPTLGASLRYARQLKTSFVSAKVQVVEDEVIYLLGTNTLVKEPTGKDITLLNIGIRYINENESDIEEISEQDLLLDDWLNEEDILEQL